LDTSILIIGAGVTGLAIACKLSQTRDGVFVVERNRKFGQETSSRNSEVVHSGIYYPKDSLKARLCVEGRRRLYQYCREKEVMHQQCGKYVVATNREECAELPSIRKRARANGVESGELIGRDRLQQHEPHVEGLKALYFGTSGIVDSHGLMKQLETDAVVNGVQMAYNNEVNRISRIEGGYEVEVIDASGKFSFTTGKVINAAGLGASEVCRMAGISDEQYRQHFWKGQYWAVGNGKHKLVHSLIYPVPQKALTGLGIHATIDMNGGLKLGPDAVYLGDRPLDYKVDPASGDEFMQAVKPFLPFLEREDLHPDQAGIRPKLQKPGEPVKDFIIREEKDRDLPGFVNLLGIESPGLTACLAIADYVEGLTG